MNNSLYELIPSMSPDSLRTFLKTTNSFFDTHTKKNIGYEDINGDQYVGTTENYGSEILMESRKMLMNNPSLKNLFTKNTFDYYFDIEFCPMVDSYYQSNMMYALLSKDVLISSRRYNITFTNCEEVIVLRSESSSDPNVKKSRFIRTSTPPTLNIIDPNGLTADETVSLEITDDTSNTEYYFLIDITTEDFIDNFDETTHVLKTKDINDADAGLPFVWICNDKFNRYPILEFNNNIDDSNHPLMTIGTNGHDIYGLYPYAYGTSNVPALPDPTHEGVESTYTDTVGANTTLGGWSPGDKADNMTLQEFAHKLLHVYIPPTVVFTTTPSDTLFEKGTSVPSITLSVVVTKNSDTISKIEFLQNDAVIKTISTGVSDGGTFTNTISTPITTDKKYSVRITDTSGKEAVVKDINISFIPASYYGILNDETKIKELNTVLKLDADYTYKSIVMTNQRVCYATPTQYGDVKVIKDSNGFDITSAFTFSTMTINDQPYTVITLTNTGTYPTANPGTIIFSK